MVDNQIQGTLDCRGKDGIDFCHHRTKECPQSVHSLVRHEVSVGSRYYLKTGLGWVEVNINIVNSVIVTKTLGQVQMPVVKATTGIWT